eukprot:EG_transcript_34668
MCRQLTQSLAFQNISNVKQMVCSDENERLLSKKRELLRLPVDNATFYANDDIARNKKSQLLLKTHLISGPFSQYFREQIQTNQQQVQPFEEQPTALNKWPLQRCTWRPSSDQARTVLSL